MSPEQIRALKATSSFKVCGEDCPTTDEYLALMCELLKEIAAQLAERNQAKSASAVTHISHRKQPREMSSPMRRNGKMFYHHGWITTLPEDMFKMFTPHEGQKWPSELEIDETSTGTMGTNTNTTITRKK